VVAGDRAVSLQTPFGLQVVVPGEELTKNQAKIPDWPGQFPLDREMTKYLRRLVTAAETPTRAKNKLPYMPDEF